MSQFQTVDLFDDNNDFGFNSYDGTENSNKSKPSEQVTFDSKDIVIQIRDQETTNENYINYIIEVTIKSDKHFWLEKTQEKSWSVSRRYSEFDSLRIALVKSYPACLVPPLPSKINSFNPWTVAHQKKDSDFIDSRRQRLEMFLNRLLAHPRLKEEILIFTFLHEKENWSDLSVKQDITQKVGSVVNWRWINVQSRMINMFDNYSNTSYFNDLVKSNSLSDEAIKIIDKGKFLQDNMKKLINCLTKVDEQMVLFHHLYKNYGEAFFDWCAMDKSMGDTLQSFGHMCDTFSTLIDSPTSTEKPIVLPHIGTGNGGAYTILSWNDISLLLQELYEFGECWIDLGGRLAFLDKQLYKHIVQTESKSEQLERLKSGQPMKSGGFSSITNKFKKSLSESEVSDLTSNLESTLVLNHKSLDSMKANKELFNQCVEEEIMYFESCRLRDMHMIMHSYACNQLAHSEKCLRLWQRARQALE